MATEAVVVFAGFSKLNRWLLYASLMLSPAQLWAGIGSNSPVNLGFLAYNWYTQIQWYQAVRAHQVHALSLLPVHFNLLYAFTYLGGISAGNLPMGIFLAFGTAGVIVLNNVTAWTSWATCMSEGFGKYEFFFFGWRTLSPSWHKFFLLWQIGDSGIALGCLFIAFSAGIGFPLSHKHEEWEEEWSWWFKYLAIPISAALALLVGWDLILWVELIYARNHIDSPTDWIAVWLFCAQVGLFLLPSVRAMFKGCRGLARMAARKAKEIKNGARVKHHSDDDDATAHDLAPINVTIPPKAKMIP